MVPTQEHHRSPFRSERVLPALLCAALLLAAAGCDTDAPPARSGASVAAPSSGSSRIDEINLIAMPVPVNLESLPGVDGVMLKVFAVDSRHPHTQPIRTGTLELLLFDGLVRPSAAMTNGWLHQWSFPAVELSGYAFTTTTIGTGYTFRLGWGLDRPHQEQITLIARYLAPGGAAIYSAPSYLPMPKR